MCTLDNLSEYQCKFLKIARILINSCKLSDLDQDALFLSGLPANLETQVRQRLLITKSTHHPSDPYPIAGADCAGSAKAINGPRNRGQL